MSHLQEEIVCANCSSAVHLMLMQCIQCWLTFVLLCSFVSHFFQGLIITTTLLTAVLCSMKYCCKLEGTLTSEFLRQVNFYSVDGFFATLSVINFEKFKASCPGCCQEHACKISCP